MQQLLRGGPPLKGKPVIYAASLLTEATQEIELHDFEVISSVPEIDWSTSASVTKRWGIPESRILQYAEWGLLVCDASAPNLVELNQRDGLLRTVRWNRYAQLSHFLSKWSDEFLGVARKNWHEMKMPVSFAEFEERFGPAPASLPEVPDVLDRIELPLIQRDQSLFQLLRKRRTTRSFDLRKRLSLDDLSVILYYCFGCHGYKKMSKTLTVLKKTSPSGGALHPIEVYPLVSRVEGLDAGTYHYNAARHSLDMLEKIPQAEVRKVALRVLAEQKGLSEAHVMFILVARYGRHFWKYRSHPKAFKVVCMDAAHLSQTHYLVCTELGLGAYVTGAINDKYTEALFGLDGVNNGVVAICGSGVPRRHDPEQLTCKPFVPRQTKLTN